MNTPATSMAWMEIIPALAINVGLIVAVSGLGQRFIRSASVRRIVWQGALVAVMLVFLIEATGARSYVISEWLSSTPSMHRGFLITTVETQDKIGEETAASSHESPTSAWDESTPWALPSESYLMGWMSRVWLLGFLAILAGVTGRHWILAAYLRRMPVLQHSNLLQRIRHLSALMRLRSVPTLRLSERLRDPVALGLIQPTICLPADFSRRYSSAEQDVMLMHELAHLKSRDPWWQLVVNGLTAALWWHPFVWWMRRQWHRVSEMAADESSQLLEHGPATLAGCLVAVGRQLTENRALGWLGIDGAPFRSGLGRRVARLMTLKDGHACPSRPSTWRRVFLAILAPCFFITLTLGATGWIQSHAGGEPSLTGRWDQSPLGVVWDSWAKQDTEADVALAFSDKVAASLTTPRHPTPSVQASVESARERSLVTADPSPSTPTSAPAHVAPLDEATPEFNSVQVGDKVQYYIQPTLAKADQAPDDTPPANELPEDLLAASPRLFTRWFKADLQTFARNLRATKTSDDLTTEKPNASNGDTNPTIVMSRFIDLMRQAGVNVESPRAVFFNDRQGMLMVRASLEELEIAERLIEELNTSPQQVLLKVHLCEISAAGTGKASLNRLFESPIHGTNSSQVTAILTAPQFESMLSNLNASAGVDLLTAPKVTTLSGRQTQIKVVDIRYIVTDLDYASPGEAEAGQSDTPQEAKRKKQGKEQIRPVAEPFELGPIVDIVPTVSADQATIQLLVVANIKEFLGYDQSGEFEAYLKSVEPAHQQAELPSERTPLPHFRQRQVVGSAVVADGQTLVLHGGSVVVENILKDKVPILGDIPLAGRLFRKERKEHSTRLLAIFITPQLIDATGHPMRAEAPKP